MAYFEYCTIQDLRDEGITPEECPDQRAQVIIRRASAKINIFTSQWFSPIIGDQYVDGQNSRMVWLPNYVPIAKLTAIEVDRTKTARTGPYLFPNRRAYDIQLTDVALSRHGRMVEIIADVTNASTTYPDRWYDSGLEEAWFPEGRRNIKLTGVFGWLEDVKDVESTVVGDWAIRSPKIQIDNASAWEEGDTCIFPDGSSQIVTGVKKLTNELYFQTDFLKLRVAVSNGNKVQSYGRIPQLIRYATIRLVSKMYERVGESSNSEDIISQAIIAEKTDNYSYRLDPSLLRERIESGISSTGDVEVDSILAQMVDEIPVYVGFA
jgi:hypothetical protein